MVGHGDDPSETLRDIRSELQDILHDVNEALDRGPGIDCYSDLAAGMSCSLETIVALCEDLTGYAHVSLQREIQETQDMIPR